MLRMHSPSGLGKLKAQSLSQKRVFGHESLFGAFSSSKFGLIAHPGSVQVEAFLEDFQPKYTEQQRIRMSSSMS